jgi:hypothetical protein
MISRLYLALWKFILGSFASQDDPSFFPSYSLLPGRQCVCDYYCQSPATQRTMVEAKVTRPSSRTLPCRPHQSRYQAQPTIEQDAKLQSLTPIVPNLFCLAMRSIRLDRFIRFTVRSFPTYRDHPLMGPYPALKPGTILPSRYSPSARRIHHLPFIWPASLPVDALRL